MITTERTKLRPLTCDDAENYAEMNADPLVRKHFPSVLTREISDKELDSIIDHQSQHGFSFWAVEIEGELAGFCGFARTADIMPFPQTVEIGWRLKSKYWRQGYTFEAATACLQYGFETLNFPEVISYTADPNIPSWSLMEKLGMARGDNFAHPMLPENHPLARHRLYDLVKFRPL